MIRLLPVKNWKHKGNCHGLRNKKSDVSRLYYWLFTLYYWLFRIALHDNAYACYHFMQHIQRIPVRWITCAVWFGDYRPIHSIYGIINGCMRGTTSILATATMHLSHKFIACSVNTFFHLVVSCWTVHNVNKALWGVVYNPSKTLASYVTNETNALASPFINTGTKSHYRKRDIFVSDMKRNKFEGNYVTWRFAFNIKN